jgi:hypothetical protein
VSNGKRANDKWVGETVQGCFVAYFEITSRKLPSGTVGICNKPVRILLCPGRDSNRAHVRSVAACNNWLGRHAQAINGVKPITTCWTRMSGDVHTINLQPLHCALHAPTEDNRTKSDLTKETYLSEPRHPLKAKCLCILIPLLPTILRSKSVLARVYGRGTLEAKTNSIVLSRVSPPLSP